MIKVGDNICPICGGSLIYYDKVFRKLRLEYRKFRLVKLKRFRCKECRCTHRELPDYIYPYKHYTSRIINGVISGSIHNEILEYEDYPCDNTIERWKKLRVHI